MDISTVANILVAASIAHGTHSIAEPNNILNKVRELSALVNKKKYEGKIPSGIDTRLKAYGLGLVSVLIPFLVSFVVVSMLFSITIQSAMWFAIVIMLGIEMVNTVNIDKYHVEIEQIAKKYRKKA